LGKHNEEDHMEITTAGATALVDCGTNRQGTPIPACTATEVRQELERAGLIGPGGGLTRTGTVYRQRLMDEVLEKAFGA
jgi:hypothetical protein